MNIDLKKINWKQPKYILPAIIYLPLIGLGWLIVDLFHTSKAEVPTSMETTEYLNPSLPEARLKDDGIGSKYDNMAKSWGKIQDFSAVETLDQTEHENTEEYNSRYSQEDLEMLDAAAKAQADAEMERIRAMQSRLERSSQAGEQMMAESYPDVLTEDERLLAANQRQQQALDELNVALAQARLQGRNSVETPEAPVDGYSEEIAVSGEITIKETAANAVTELDDDAEAGKMVKRTNQKSDYFNTIAENESEPNLIKAIIDEDIRAVEGSRVRLRLLDDVEIDGTVVTKGSYIYATMSGFGSQRVKGSVQSMLVKDELIKVNLTLYDTDGLEGLYIPQSAFRETTRDIASGAMSNSMNINNSSYTNSFEQWGMQSLQNGIQKSFDAISKSIRKNKAKLKYGTFVYLVNGREKRN